MKFCSVNPEEALEKWFPNATGFRDRQRDVLERVWSGQSTLVLMPTGVGKSMIFQLPVLAAGGVGVIISPLIALMQQQANNLRSKGVTVLSLGGSDAKEAQESLRKFSWSGGPAFLFVSPERLETDGYLEFLLRKHRAAIKLVAVDEAHCISQWGHDFRPPYKSIPGFLDRAFGRGSWPVVLCLTATLDNYNEQEILKDFRLDSKDVVRSHTMLRTNLELSFQVCENNDKKLETLELLLQKHREEKIIVYTHLKQSPKWGTRALAERFRALGFRCAPFDADLTMEVKDTTLRDFVDGKINLVFATGAFGMGVDIPDIRGVIHFLLPESLEQYYQEVGRAGRDGKSAIGVLLHTATNAKVRRDMIRDALRSEDQVRNVWEEVCEIGTSALRSISPWIEFRGKDDEYALFYAFQGVGALEVIARGPGRLNCFEPRGPEGMELFQRLIQATRTGTITAAIRKLDLDPAKTMDLLFDLYDRGELKLMLSPDKTLLFKIRKLQDSEIQTIVADISSKVEKRLADFEAFVELINSDIDPSQSLKARFGGELTQTQAVNSAV